jgi:hypothetical protein
MDSMADQLFDGHRFRLLAIVDNFSRKSLVIRASQRPTGDDRDWFTIHDENRLRNLYVTEQYIPAQYMDTLIVLIVSRST